MSVCMYVYVCLYLCTCVQAAFGLASAFVPYYVLGTIVAGSPTLGPTYVGALLALVVAAGAATAAAAGGAASAARGPDAIGGSSSGRVKAALMVGGGVCLALTGGVLLVYEDETLGTWGGIVPLLLIYGVGRGIWVRCKSLPLLTVGCSLALDAGGACPLPLRALTTRNGVDLSQRGICLQVWGNSSLLRLSPV